MSRAQALALDRMEIEGAGPEPQRLAQAIHAQLGPTSGPIPIYKIAAALDIIEVPRAPLKGLEAALVTGPERDVGVIAINSISSMRRQRFSVAHELGHILNLLHRPLTRDGFACRAEDLRGPWGSPSLEAQLHQRQESEANQFAIELLAPRKIFRPYLTGIPDLAHVLRFADQLDLSKQACARRYAELHNRPVALVFSRNGVVRYIERSDGFPYLTCGPGSPLAAVPSPTGQDGLSNHVEADPRDWLGRPGRRDLVLQTLRQNEGYAITLLAFDASERDDEQEL